MKPLVILTIAALAVLSALFAIPRYTGAATNDFQRVLQREFALEQSHPTYFAVVYIVTGHVPAAQGRLAEIGADYFCISHAPSRECFALDKVSSVDFFDGQ